MKLLSEYWGENELENRKSKVYLVEKWSAVSQAYVREYVVEFITKNLKVSRSSPHMEVRIFHDSIRKAENRAENWVMGVDK
tara:strand:+ start:227 stop:469 length:243 start_codon:yes stop_codon:yes gene_type:complete